MMKGERVSITPERRRCFDWSTEAYTGSDWSKQSHVTVGALAFDYVLFNSILQEL